MRKEIAIVGFGEIGRALARILGADGRGIAVKCWDSESGKVSGQRPLSEIVPNSDVIFLCVPSWAAEGALAAVSPHLKTGTIVAALAKGMEAGANRTMDELLTHALPNGQPGAVIGGPLLAEEIAAGMDGIAVIGANERSVFDRISAVFADTPIILERSEDRRGVAAASALKNIYAVELGIIDALGLGANVKGWFASRALGEMAEILPLLGGRSGTALGTAGLGDLIATGFSPFSRNRTVGGELAAKGVCSVKSEGCVSLAPLLIRLGRDAGRFPCLAALRRVIIDGEHAKTIFNALARTIISAQA